MVRTRSREIAQFMLNIDTSTHTRLRLLSIALRKPMTAIITEATLCAVGILEEEHADDLRALIEGRPLPSKKAHSTARNSHRARSVLGT